MAAGTRLWRVMIDQLGSTEPSTSQNPTRFTPVRDGAGSVVPALYLGDSLGCALCETVLRGRGDAQVLTERWSQHVWDSTQHSGLVWNSYRDPRRLSYLLFVDAGERWTDRCRVHRRDLAAGGRWC